MTGSIKLLVETFLCVRHITIQATGPTARKRWVSKYAPMNTLNVQLYSPGLYNFVREFRRAYKQWAYIRTKQKHFKTSNKAVLRSKYLLNLLAFFKLQNLAKNRIHLISVQAR